MTDGQIRNLLDDVARQVLEGSRLDAESAVLMLEHEDLSVIAALADLVRRRKHPDRVVTYVVDRNINYTNICTMGCRFCAFHRNPGAPDGYVLSTEQIVAKIREMYEVGGKQVLMQGGHNPDLGLDYYETLFKTLKHRFPDLWLHALSPPEVVHISNTSGLPVDDVIRKLVEAGLDSIPGGGAEILDDGIRARLSPAKCSSSEWLEVMEEAHTAGMRTTATMMFGHIESVSDRVRHLERIRALQDRTSGFTAFICWTFQPENTALGGNKTTAAEYLRTVAVSRIFLDNIDNIQASWVTQGARIGTIALAFGCNDMGSTMLEENVVSAAGTSHRMSERDMIRAIESAGFKPARRDMQYRILPEVE